RVLLCGDDDARDAAGGLPGEGGGGDAVLDADVPDAPPAEDCGSSSPAAIPQEDVQMTDAPPQSSIAAIVTPSSPTPMIPSVPGDDHATEVNAKMELEEGELETGPVQSQMDASV